jgi:hypothetical protein
MPSGLQDAGVTDCIQSLLSRFNYKYLVGVIGEPNNLVTRSQTAVPFPLAVVQWSPSIEVHYSDFVGFRVDLQHTW